MSISNWKYNTEQSLVENHGLKHDEFESIVEGLGREPNLTELGIFSAMWNEHCSYKSSKYWLKKLPTSGDRVVQGPGENAGVIDIDDGDVAVFKMESHNHPSFIEPYQGAATGVGGILRDVFTMGARPVANLNALRFGEIDHPKTKHLLSGVVEGIGGYGNCIGIPTVGGEVNFHHKRNPVLSENLTGISRLIRSYVIPSMENITLWHERDISHSSVERMMAPDANVLTDFSLARMTNIISNLVVYPKNMLSNLNKLNKLPMSEGLMLALTQKGMPREKAYKMIQRNAMKVWKTGEDFSTLLTKDKEVSQHLSKKEINQILDINHSIKKTNQIFKKIFKK